MKRVARRTKHTLVVVTLALASCRGPMQSPTPTPEIVPLYFVTSTNTHPILQELSRAYVRDNALVAIVDQSSSGFSLQKFWDEESPPNDKVYYALTTYLPMDSELWAAPLGQDGIAIIVHPDLVISALSADNLRAIFTGVVDNWIDLGGQNLAITVVSGENNAPTNQAFQLQVLGQRPITRLARLATTSNALLEIVSQTPGAIGFMSMTLVDERVQVLPLINQNESVRPTPQTVANNSYPLQMPLLVIGRQPPEPGDGYYEFILWAQQAGGQSIIGQHYAALE